jgi:putative DNA primase/helicase
MSTTGNDRKAAKQTVDGRKKRLPGVMWSGTFRRRNQNDLLQHSGLLCADLDELAERITELRAKLVTSLHLWALFTSPTGDGLKCVFRVPADAERHKASFRAVERHVRELAGVQIDQSCSDVSRLCFLSYDPDVHLNEDAVELPLLPEVSQPVKPAEGTDCDGQAKTRQQVANELLGPINWTSEDQGYCTCPGKRLHTTADGDRDCRVCVDSVPTIHCFHNNCRVIVTALNRELRSRTNKVEQGVSQEYPRNDTERAVRFVQQFGADLRYVPAWKAWVVWDGIRWLRGSQGLVFRKAQKLPRLLLEEATSIEDSDRRKKAAAAAIAAGNECKITAMLEVARHQAGIEASPTLFDADPYLVGVLNGVVNLRTGTFRPARREDYVTKQLGAAFDPDATCPTWEKFVARVFNNNRELISFIQRAVGYTLTGDVHEQCLFFPYGTRQNGKSTFVETVHPLCGDYALKTTTSLYTVDGRGKEPEAEIARLLGKRFVSGSEIEEGAKLAESRVKDLTGGDTLTGRHLYCPPFNFDPTHKLWIYGNHLPDVRGNDQGIWRRIRLIPFEVQIPDAEKDPDLQRKLEAELPGILNWAIRGCLEWQKRGLGTPQVVIEATEEYREDEDQLGEFISDVCLIKEGDRVERSQLYWFYKSWAASRGMKYPLGQKGFAKRLRSRGITNGGKSGPLRYWAGVSIRPDAVVDPEVDAQPILAAA